jgi:PAS domain S-box-containing protein
MGSDPQLSSQQIAEMTEGMPGPVLRLRRDGVMIYANAAARDTLRRLEELPEEMRASWHGMLSVGRSLRTAGAERCRVGDQCFLFQIKPCAAANAIDLVGVDITEDCDREASFEDIAASVPGALLQYVTLPNGEDHIEYMNPNCYDLWGIGAEELAGDPTPLWDMIVPEHVESMRRSIQHSAMHQLPWRLEWKIRTHKGVEKWLSGSGMPRKLGNGSVRWTTIVIDVTPQKRRVGGLR